MSRMAGPLLVALACGGAGAGGSTGVTTGSSPGDGTASVGAASAPSQPADAPPGAPQPFAAGIVGGPAERTRLVVRSQAEWDAVAPRLSFPGKASPPAFDFSRQTLVVVAMGEQRTGGYGIRVAAAAVDAAGVLRIRVVTTSPGPRCAVTQLITAPFEAVALPRFDGTVAFDEEQATASCG